VTDTVVVGYLDDGHWSACFGLSYRDLLLADASTQRRIVRPGGTELRQVCGTGGIPAGRNSVVKGFLDDTDADWLFMVDTDMGFAADTVEALLAAADPVQRPVVGALCFALKRTESGNPATLFAERWRIAPTVFLLHEIPDRQEVGMRPVYDYPRDALVQVHATGAACLLIHRDIASKIRAETGDNWFDPITHPTGDGGKPRAFSEDLSFCLRVGRHAPVYVHTGVKTCHEKGGIFLDEFAFDRQENQHTPAPRIALVCPTRNRVRQVEQMVQSAMATAAGPVEVVLYADDDAPLPDRFSKTRGVTVVTGPRILLSEAWNTAAGLASADILMHCGDDIVFRTPGWDERVVREFAKVPDRIVFVHGNDLLQGPNLGTHGFLHRRWVDAVGYLVPPHFSSDYNDTWLTEVADKLGRRVYLPDVVTEHMHPLAGKAEWDLTHRERLERHKADDVDQLYKQLAAQREADVAKLRAVMS
jgi:hypothetical protein